MHCKSDDVKDAVDKIDWDAIEAGDGKLPGGMSADVLKTMATKKEVMAIMSDPKVQEMMKAVMEKDMAKVARMSTDMEIMEKLQRFQVLAQESGMDPAAMMSGGGF